LTRQPVSSRLIFTTSRAAVTAIFASIAFVGLSPTFASAASPPTVDAKIMAAAKEWFHRYQTGDIDRSQFNAEVNRQVTADGVRTEQATLKPFGEPLSFRYLGSGPIGGAMGYYFLLQFHAGRIIEAIAYDPNGKIAGLDFETFLLNSPDSST